jgi:hypothetical protein
MSKHITAIAVLGCICAATVTAATACTPTSLPAGGGLQIVMPEPLAAGRHPHCNFSKVYNQVTRSRITRPTALDGNRGLGGEPLVPAPM